MVKQYNFFSKSSKVTATIVTLLFLVWFIACIVLAAFELYWWAFGLFLILPVATLGVGVWFMVALIKSMGEL